MQFNQANTFTTSNKCWHQKVHVQYFQTLHQNKKVQLHPSNGNLHIKYQFIQKKKNYLNSAKKKSGDFVQ